MCDGIVLYTDGSFRQNLAGWGVHGYTFNDSPMKAKAATKQQPTSQGYKDVSADETCTVIDYIDAFGKVEGKATNNTAELQACLEGFKIAQGTDAKVLRMYLDSEYVRKGLTQWIGKWIKNNWTKADQSPVANKDLWIELLAEKEKWTSTGRFLDMAWVEGHSGDMGNDKADVNALRGGGANSAKPVQVNVEAVEINKLKKKPVTPLVLETRLLFGINSGVEADGFYYSYNLGRMHNAGARPRDTAKDKLAKADLLLGRRISEATFCVYKAKELDEYFESLIKMHTEALGTDNPELGIINLANACNAKQRQRIESLGVEGLMKYDDIHVLATPEMGLISKTLNPPRMANDAFFEFNILEGRLKSYLDGTLGDNVTKVDITDLFYEKVTSGKKTITQLKKSITQNTGHLDIPIKFKGKDVKLKLCLALDILSRNQLNRCACDDIKMELLVTSLGAMSYAYSTVIVTEDGAAIYGSPYTQFILK
ncbi:ribonuclease H [Pseudomonas phage Phabio]|uniref:ribonuclease H n=1 Tax=Pseudomonas phage Phabio TaxID=2006668 RepID=A0A1Y0SZB4_9CAUD|nr:ribonuclease [Pseudomonas phage Phabio]ARV76859.1 ribonuclease H [Pseudomonas phage Phabio]